MPREVRGRDGRVWTVGRHWAGRLGAESLWTRFRNLYRRSRHTVDIPDPGCLEVFSEGLLVGITIIVVGLLFVFLGLPVLLALLDLIFVILLVLLGTVARVVFRRPWTIEARPSNGVAMKWRVVGWRASSEFIREVERRIEHGEALPSIYGSGPVI